MQIQEATNPPVVVLTPAKPTAVFRRYAKRHWAVYEGDNLICVTVYKRGAARLVERLEEDDERGAE